MSTIQDLEREIQRLENLVNQKDEQMEQLVQKCEKALDLAIHAYRVDHFGYIWQYNCETKEYVKSNMRVCTPEVADRALHSRHIADRAIEGRHLQDDCIDGNKISPNSVPGRCIADESITGDHMEGEVVLPGKLAADAVWTRNIRNKAVTREKVSDDFFDPLRAKDRDLQNQIESLVAGSSVPISTEFGDSDLLVISQRVVTEAFNKVWGKLEEITGESLKGFSLIVTPEYYIGEEGCTVHISASSADTAGRFEYIRFYINNILVTEAADVESFEHTTTVNETCEIKCVAKILGIEYTETKVLTHYSSFFLGASTSYINIMNVAHVIPVNNEMKGSYSVPCNDGDHLYVVVGKSLRDGFARADMNGVEIQFTESEVTVGGRQYVVFTSKGTIERGTYNIDINS